MANIDYSKYSDEELERIASGGNSQGQTPKQDKTKLNYKEMLNFNPQFSEIGKIPRGLVRGAMQSAGDLGASALNAPIGAAEYLSGHKIPHVPHPDFLNKNPSSVGESAAQTIGQLAGGFALPGGAGLKAAQLAGKGYKALQAGKELPLIGKLLAGSVGGAAEGALGNEENRKFGAELGAGLGAAGHGIPAVIKWANSMRSKDIAKHVSNEVGRLDKAYNERFTGHLKAGEEAGANEHLVREKANLANIRKAGESGSKRGEKKLTHALEEYNLNPTLTNAHNAQRDLGKLERMHAGAPEGTLEHRAYQEAKKIKNRMILKISEAFEKAGAKEHGTGYQQAREDFRKEVVPYINSKAISDLLGKNKERTQTLRPKEFADILLKDEQFLTQTGHKHPGLLRREKIKKAVKNPATIAALGYAAGYLPDEIRKLLGQH